MPEEKEVHRSADFDLMTVDVWDTLLRRRCHPDAVKLHVCRYVMLRHGRQLPDRHRDPWVLLRLRQQAEKELAEESQRLGFDDEYTHCDVYERWLSLAGLTIDSSREEAAQLYRALEQIELEQERYVSYVDPSIRRTLEGFRARKTLFVTDFYLPSGAVKELLAFHDMDGLITDGIASCDVKLNKKSGRLFRRLHETLGITPHRHLHIGDQQWADVELPRQIGMTAVHYLPEEEHRQRQQREQGFHARDRLLRSAVRSVCGPGEDGHHDDGSLPAQLYELGRRASLCFVSFILHVMERAVADGVDKLFFLTREGELFLTLYRRAAEIGMLGCQVPEGILLEASRMSTFAGSLQTWSCAELMRIWNQYSTQSLHALLTSLDIESSRFADKAASYGVELHQEIVYPWQDARVRAWLADEWVKAEIDRELADKRTRLLSYLASVGLPGAHTKVGIVDIGWRGTIQDNLAYVLPTIQLHGYYLGLIRYLNAQPPNITKSAFGPDLNEAQPDYPYLLDFVAPVEMLCNSPHGTVQRYEATEAGVKTSRLIDAEENRVHESFIRHFQAGVIDSVAYWADFIRTHAFTSREIRPLAMDIWTGLIHRPPSCLAKVYFALNHNETFGVGRFSDKRRLLGTHGVLLAFLSRSRREQLHRFLTEVGWVPGLMANPDTAPAFRWTLRAFMTARNIRRLAHDRLHV
ncbi:MAG: haloacid dehalogenase [Candidatus Methylomirabilota bacterium]|nr:MAG: haloacid dehalogenase [candidate division NC10 bacterium]